MAGLQFHTPPGIGQWAKDNLHYSQAVRIDNQIRLSGQGGWNAQDPNIDLTEDIIPTSLDEEIDQAFANCDFQLKFAGGKGMSQVFRVVTYATNIAAAHERIIYNYRKWMPDHQPLWTELGVRALGLPTMRFEVDVEAYDPRTE